MTTDTYGTERRYAGFWVRAVATVADIIVMIPLMLALQFVAAQVFLDGGMWENFTRMLMGEVPTAVQFWYHIVFTTLVWIGIYALFVTSRWQAMPGHYFLGLRIETDTGEPLTFPRAAARIGVQCAISLMILLPSLFMQEVDIQAMGQKEALVILLVESILVFLFLLICFVWYGLAGWTREKTALHDKICRTRVVVATPQKGRLLFLLIAEILLIAGGFLGMVYLGFQAAASAAEARREAASRPPDEASLHAYRLTMAELEAAVHAPTPSFPITPPPIATERYEIKAREVAHQIMQGEFETVERFLGRAMRERTRTRWGSDYVEELVGHMIFDNKAIREDWSPEGLEPHLERWVQSRPESVVARYLRSRLYTTLAWKSRGTGWAKDVKHDQWRGFHTYLHFSLSDVQAAYALAPESPYANVMFLRVAHSRSVHHAIKRALFERSRRRHPGFRSSSFVYLYSQYPSWGGSWEETWAHAYGMSSHVPEWVILPELIIEVHKRFARHGAKNRKAYLNRPEVWEEIETIYAQLLRQYPSAHWYIEYARTARLAGKKDLAYALRNKALTLEPDYTDFYRK